jgi:glycosyltransferase involved in cell wall biosynthesis
MRDEPGLVSIITPCYNAARFVAETIESVAVQTYAPVEHIIVDDGSTDESWAIIESFGSRINAVGLDHNRGGSYARNRGAERARGEFLMFLDSDDLIAPDTLGALVMAVRARPAGIAACPWRRLRLVEGNWVEAPPEASPPLLHDPLRGWLQNCWVPPCAVLWRRDAYERTGGWDERITLNDDGDLMMRAFVRGCSLVSAAGGQALYRHHGGTRLSLSNDVFSEAKLRSLCIVLENLTGELQRAAKLPIYRAWLGRAYYRVAAMSFQQQAPQIGRDCVAHAENLVGRRAAGRTWPGRLLTLLLGVEWKERVVEALASVGIMTPTRRRTRAARRLYAHRAGF